MSADHAKTAAEKRRFARRLMIIGAGLLLLGVGAFFAGLNLGWETSEGASRQGTKFALLQAGGAGFGFGLASLMLGFFLMLGARRKAPKG